MHHSRTHRLGLQQLLLPSLLVIFVIGTPDLAMAQASPFMTGATSLQTNLLAWLTPVAIILVMVLGGMAMANRVVENCADRSLESHAAHEWRNQPRNRIGQIVPARTL